MPSTISRVRVALLTEAIYNGGAERWIEDLVSSTDHEHIEWLGVGVSEKVVSQVAAQRISNHVPLLSGRDECERLAKAADVVIAWPHLHTFGLPEGKPAIWVSHSGPESKWGVDHARAPKRGFTTAVAVSDEAVRSYEASQWNDVVVVENGLNRNRLVPQASPKDFRRRHGIPSSGKMVGYIGRLSPEKGFKAFCKSAQYLPDSWNLVVAGAAYYEDNRQMVDSLVGGRVHMIGELDDIGTMLHAVDALVVPSLHESFGYSIVEGWGAKVPVIATCVGVAKKNPDLIRATPNPASPRDIAMALIEDMSNPEDTALRCERASAWVDAHYPVEKFGLEWTQLICRVAGK